MNAIVIGMQSIGVESGLAQTALAGVTAIVLIENSNLHLKKMR